MGELKELEPAHPRQTDVEARIYEAWRADQFVLCPSGGYAPSPDLPLRPVPYQGAGSRGRAETY